MFESDDDDSCSDCSYESLLMKYMKEKDAKILPKLQPYFLKIISLVQDIKEKEIALNYYSLKLAKIKDEYPKINKKLDEKESILMSTFINSIETEEFYLDPHDPEIKELAERARDRKKKYNDIQDIYNDDKDNIRENEKNFQNELDNLSNDDQKLYLILKEYLLHDKDISKIKNDLDFMGIPENKIKAILRDNKAFLREAKNKTRDKKNELINLKKEVKAMDNNKTMKTTNHLNFTNNMSAIKYKSDISNNNSMFYDNINNINNNINQSLDNSFIFSNDLNRTNCSVPYNATKLTNLNKTFYLRTNKSNFENMRNLNNFDNNPEKPPYSGYKHKNKSCSRFIRTEDNMLSDDAKGKRKNSICRKLLKNYYNKMIDSNSDNNENFLIEMKLKKDNKNNSTGKSLLQQRKEKRENLDSYIFIHGNRYKQSAIGKATNSINGVY